MATEKASQKIGAKLIRLARETLLFHTPDGDGFARVPVGEHVETLVVRKKGFKDWLTRKFYNEFRKPPSPQALQDATSVLDAQAQFDGPEAPLHVRIKQANRLLQRQAISQVRAA